MCSFPTENSSFLLLYLLSMCITLSFTQEQTNLDNGNARLPLVACNNWDKVQRVLSDFSTSRTLCNRLENCTGLACTGLFKGSPFSLSLRLLPCSPTHAVEIQLNYTAAGIRNFNKTFNDGDELLFENVRLPVVANLTVPAYLAIDLKPTLDNFLSMSVELKGCNNDEVHARSCPIMKTLVKNQQLPIPQCPSIPLLNNVIANRRKKLPASVVSNCDIFHPFDSLCGANEECEQMYPGFGEGHCVCQSAFFPDASGNCQSNSGNIPTSTEPIPISSTPASLPSSSANTVVKILAPLFVLAVIGALIGVAIKLQWIQKIKSRLHRRLEEDIVIGSPGSNDDDLIV